MVKHGIGAVLEDFAAAEPWPVEGLYTASHYVDDVRKLYSEGLGRGAPTGWACVNDLYSVAEGQVTTITGIPSAGKSNFLDAMVVNLANDLNWRFAVCSFENDPKLHISKLISKKVGAPFFMATGECLPRKWKLRLVGLTIIFSFSTKRTAILLTLIQL